MLFPSSARAADQGSDEAKREKETTAQGVETCTAYKAKRDEVPVYQSPTSTSKVIARLSLGEEVCYVGEQDGFAILDWEKSIEQSGRDKAAGKSFELVFVLLTELWPPEDEEIGLEAHAKRVFENMGYGGQPEDVFAPLRELIYKFTGGPKCLAGEICKKVEQDLEKGDE